MNDATVSIVIVGTGLAGIVAAEAISARSGLRLGGWISTNPVKVGADSASIAKVPAGAIFISGRDSADELLADASVDLMFYAGVNEADAISEWMTRAARARIDVVSVAGPLHPRIALGSEISGRLHESATSNGVRMLSTGVNPGLLLDVLPMLCATLSPTAVFTVRATRRSDIKWWGQSVLQGYGLGRNPETWAVDAPYVTMRESMQMIIDGLRLDVDCIDESYVPTIADERQEMGSVVLEPGRISGFIARCVARRNVQDLVILEWIGEFGASEKWAVTGKPRHELTIEGDASVKCSLDGDFLGDSYPATIGRALAAIWPLRSLPPGLYRADQVPLSPLS